MPKPISHTVKRSGKTPGDPEVEIPVAEDLVTVPGIPVREKDVFVLQSHLSFRGPVRREGGRSGMGTDRLGRDELAEFHKKHHERNRALVDAAESSGDLKPTGTAETGRDLTEAIRTKARGTGRPADVGFAKLDRRYVYGRQDGTG